MYVHLMYIFRVWQHFLYRAVPPNQKEVKMLSWKLWHTVSRVSPCTLLYHLLLSGSLSHTGLLWYSARRSELVKWNLVHAQLKSTCLQPFVCLCFLGERAPLCCPSPAALPYLHHLTGTAECSHIAFAKGNRETFWQPQTFPSLFVCFISSAYSRLVFSSLEGWRSRRQRWILGNNEDIKAMINQGRRKEAEQQRELCWPIFLEHLSEE